MKIMNNLEKLEQFIKSRIKHHEDLYSICVEIHKRESDQIGFRLHLEAIDIYENVLNEINRLKNHTNSCS